MPTLPTASELRTSTLLEIIQAVADSLSLREHGTTTATTTAAITAALYPFLTGSSASNNARWVGAEFYSTSGTVPNPNPNGIVAYAPSTGVFTPAQTYVTKPDSTSNFDLYLRGVRYDDIKLAVNKALRQMEYRTVVPLSLLPDGDMEMSGTDRWTATNAAIAKVGSAGNVLHGAQGLSVTATAVSGYAQSEDVPVDPTNAGGYYVQAQARCSTSGDLDARLTVYDRTNAAIIESVDHLVVGWGTIRLSFQVPATCETIALRLVTITDGYTTYWDNVQLLPRGSEALPLPPWVTRDRQIFVVTDGDGSSKRWDKAFLDPHFHWSILADESNPMGRFSIAGLDPSVSQSLWIMAARPYAELNTDSSVCFADRTWIELAASVELLERLQNRAPAQETDAWRMEYRKRLHLLKVMNSQRMPRATRSWGFRSPF